MSVSKLGLHNFRSYHEQTIELDPVVTLVVGPNATGKTNLLEGLFVFATTKSFRARDAELIRHGQTYYRVEADIDGVAASLGFQIGERGTEKRARHDGAPKSLVDHLGTLRVVLFEPNDLMIIHGAPERRRRYLDFILTQTDKRFVRTLNQYRRVLQQRNRLLADWQGQTAELFAWNIKLTELASDIDARRRAVVAHITSLASNVYADIAGTKETLTLTYEGAADAADYPTGFLSQLERNLPRDIAAGFTTIGPHRDDFTISFKHAPIITVASRGEMRTVVLTLKLAELAYIEQQAGATPLLLLDDVFSELDDSRRRYLLDTLGGHQSVITTTNADVSAELSARHTTIHTKELQRA
jgi:DNA replication and repair protein RecF